MPYLEERCKEIKDLHRIYNKDINDTLIELVRAPELLRLAGVSENYGIELSKFRSYQYTYSKLDHSFGVALILSKFKVHQNKMINGLIHEMATPAFFRSVELFQNKKDIEYGLYDAIVGSDILFEYFLKNDISINDICNEENYNIIHCKPTKLGASALEELLHYAYFMKICDSDEIAEIYEDIEIVINEDGKEEFCFKSSRIAKQFCRLSIEFGKYYRSYEAKLITKYISDTLDLMIRRMDIKKSDLYNSTEKTIIEIGKNTSDKRIRDAWKMVKETDRVYTKFNPIDEKYCIQVKADNIYIDPLVKTRFGNMRVSNIYPETKKEIETFLNSDTDLYMYIDYKI